MKYGAMVAAATLLVFSAKIDAQRLSAPLSHLAVDGSLAGRPVPKWENGLLIGYDTDPLPARVFAYDRAGRLVTEAYLRIPGATRLMLRAIAASPSGILAVGGSAYSSEGALAAFIACFGPSGAVQRLVRTSPFAPIRMCFTSDGMLWVAGREATPDFKAEAPHDILRRYDGSGRVIQTLLPRDSFVTHDSYHPAVRAFLVASGDKVGFYSPGAREWVELSLSGTVLGRWRGIDLFPPVRVTGAGLTPEGSLYLSCVRESASEGDQIPEYYRLEKSRGVWIPVDGSLIAGRGGTFSAIVGADGDALVLLESGSSLSWVQPL